MNRTIVVVGGSSGIGLATVKQAIAEGWRAIIIDRQDPLEPVAARLITCDVVNDPQAVNVLEQLAQEEPDIDALVVTAGGAINGRLDSRSLVTWDRFFTNDTLVVLHPVRALLPSLQSAARTKGIADIVVLGSIASATAFEDAVVYGAVAAARNALAEQLRVELRGEQVRSRRIATGFVATPLTEGTRIASVTKRMAEKPLQAEDVAQVILHGLNLPHDVTVHDIVVVPTTQGWA